MTKPNPPSKPRAWSKPELVRLGTLRDVANGALSGTDGQSNGNSTKFS